MEEGALTRPDEWTLPPLTTWRAITAPTSPQGGARGGGRSLRRGAISSNSSNNSTTRVDSSTVQGKEVTTVDFHFKQGYGQEE